MFKLNRNLRADADADADVDADADADADADVDADAGGKDSLLSGNAVAWPNQPQEYSRYMRSVCERYEP